MRFGQKVILYVALEKELVTQQYKNTLKIKDNGHSYAQLKTKHLSDLDV